MRCVGTVVRGIRTPIIKENDDLATIVVDSIMAAKESEGFEFKDKDVVAITEAVVGISEGNYVTVDDIAQDLQEKFPSKNIGVTNPILSRNIFSIVLKANAHFLISSEDILSVFRANGLLIFIEIPTFQKILDVKYILLYIVHLL